MWWVLGYWHQSNQVDVTMFSLSGGHLPWLLNNPSLTPASATAVALPDLRLWRPTNLGQNPSWEKKLTIQSNLSLTGKRYYWSSWRYKNLLIYDIVMGEKTFKVEDRSISAILPHPPNRSVKGTWNVTRFGQNNRVKIPSNISLSLSYEHYQQINRQVDQQHANSGIELSFSGQRVLK